MRVMAYGCGVVLCAWVLPVLCMDKYNSMEQISGLNGAQLMFFMAIRANNVELAKIALGANGAQVTDAIDDWGLTPLHLAAFLGRVQMVEILLNDPHTKVAMWSTGLRKVTPLHLAVAGGTISQDWFTDPDAPMYIDASSNTEGYATIVKILLDYGADPNEGGQESAFCYACQVGIPEVLTVLLAHNNVTKLTLGYGLACSHQPWLKDAIGKKIKGMKKTRFSCPWFFK